MFAADFFKPYLKTDAKVDARCPPLRVGFEVRLRVLFL